MTHHQAKMSSKGQITIPVAIRDALDLKEGETVDFYLTPGTRRVELIARNGKLEDLAGCLSHLSNGKPVTVEDMDEAIAAHLTEKHDRIRREQAEWSEFEQWRAGRKAG